MGTRKDLEAETREASWDGGLVTGSEEWRAHLGEGCGGTGGQESRLRAGLKECWLGSLSGHHVVASRRRDTEESCPMRPPSGCMQNGKDSGAVVE